MTATITELDKRLTQLRNEVSTRGMERHPLILKNVSELSEELKSLAVTALVSNKVFQRLENPRLATRRRAGGSCVPTW